MLTKRRPSYARSVVDAAVFAVFIAAAQAICLRKRRRPCGGERWRYKRGCFGELHHVMDCPMAGSAPILDWIGRAGKRKNKSKRNRSFKQRFHLILLVIRSGICSPAGDRDGRNKER
jgi:hypothetical protein